MNVEDIVIIATLIGVATVFFYHGFCIFSKAKREKKYRQTIKHSETMEAISK